MPRFVTLTLNPALDLSTRVDRVVDAHKMRCEAARVHPGGGGINVARVLRRLGADVLAIGTTGGPTGERLGALLAQEQVRSAWVRISGDTRESFTVREASSGKEFRFVLPGPVMAEAEWQACLDRLEELPTPAYLVASGSLPPGVPPDFYARIARWASGRGACLVLDASGEALAAALEEGVWGIKPSLRELEQLTGARLPGLHEQLQAARELLGKARTRYVALSRGPDGAVLVGADRALQAQALQVPVAGTVGAGDSFLAGWIWGWDRTGDLSQALQTAIAASAAALQRPGTRLAEAADIERLRPQVTVKSA